MKTDVSVAMRVEDNLSMGVVGMRNAMTPFRADIGALQKELDMLTNTKLAMTEELTPAREAARKARNEFKKLGEAATDAERAAARADWHEAERHYENVRSQLAMVSRQAVRTEKDMDNAAAAISKADNRASRAGVSSKGSELLTALGTAGLYQMGGEALSGWANTLVGSAMGSAGGTLFSGALSGAAMGAMAGPVGAGVGAAIGLLGGASQVFQKKDEAFKAYVQEQTEGQLSAIRNDVTQGSAIAAQREQDAIAFNGLLGQGVGDIYLEDLRALAAKTPMEYGDLTVMSRALATGFGEDPQRMLDLMTAIGDAGATVGVGASDMTEMARALSRMEASGKTSLEYVNIFQDRGVNAIEMLGSALGVSEGKVYEMISRNQIHGREAARIIQEGLESTYAGAMDLQSQTFAGLSSTLRDAQAEMQNAYGEGFNETRKQGIEEEIGFLQGESRAMMAEANRAMGAFQASLENSKEEYIRDAQQEVLDSRAFQALMEQGTDESYAKAGEMLMRAKVRGMNEYNASDGAQLMVDMELSLANAIREDAASNSAYWDAGYRKGEEYSKGFGVGITDFLSYGPPREEVRKGVGQADKTNRGVHSGAYGFRRIPYNNYEALLHEGERVLTASESRAYDQSRNTQVSVSVGSLTVREEADVNRIALKLAEMIETARMGGAR